MKTKIAFGFLTSLLLILSFIFLKLPWDSTARFGLAIALSLISFAIICVLHQCSYEVDMDSVFYHFIPLFKFLMFIIFFIMAFYVAALSFNFTDSIPKGLYKMEGVSERPERGDLVTFGLVPLDSLQKVKPILTVK